MNMSANTSVACPPAVAGGRLNQLRVWACLFLYLCYLPAVTAQSLETTKANACIEGCDRSVLNGQIPMLIECYSKCMPAGVSPDLSMYTAPSAAAPGITASGTSNLVGVTSLNTTTAASGTNLTTGITIGVTTGAAIGLTAPAPADESVIDCRCQGPSANPLAQEPITYFKNESDCEAYINRRSKELDSEIKKLKYQQEIIALSTNPLYVALRKKGLECEISALLSSRKNSTERDDCQACTLAAFYGSLLESAAEHQYSLVLANYGICDGPTVTDCENTWDCSSNWRVSADVEIGSKEMKLKCEKVKGAAKCYAYESSPEQLQ